MSKDEGYLASQSLTTVAIAEQVTMVENTDDLVRLTAKRSVFSADDLEEWGAAADNPVKVIDFLLIGHVDPLVSLTKLVEQEIIAGPPQSIIRLSEDRYSILKPLLRLGFDF
jgi:hypothetical protein